jgi:D-alanyl-D-alanine carboxypeptidase/D-alanyl-D-alanine-endopeptidase (penicillin-binding protein 4)
VLKGDLHLVGSGDPSLDRSDLTAMARQIAASGIRGVEGRFLYHGDALPQVSMIDRGQPAGAIYNPGVSGLNLDYNEGRGGAPLSDPARETALAMRRAASAAGVTLPVPVPGRGGATGAEVAAHDSAPVSALLTTMFDRSRNITAEAMGAAAAADLSAKPATLREAAAINAAWAQSRIGDIGGSGWAGFDLANSSGLSTNSRATARQIAALVRHGYRQHGETFRSMFARQSGGASNGVSYDVRAKIGTMSYVRGLSGILSLGGRDMIFAILATDPSRSDGSARAWMGKARQLEKALLSDWLQNNWPSVQTASR